MNLFMFLTRHVSKNDCSAVFQSIFEGVMIKIKCMHSKHKQ